MRLALITPWPPQATGIADYAFDLARGLTHAGHQVSVITQEHAPRELAGVEFVHTDNLTDALMDRFDQRIYHMGNNADFHLFMIWMLPKYPGIVHVHDLVLHHIMNCALPPMLYRTVLNKWYGPCALRLSDELRHTPYGGLWSSTLVTEYPMFEELIQHATACIVHSHFSRARIQGVFPNKRVTVLPQLYQVQAHQPFAFEHQAFQVGLFGGVDANKRIEVILKALAQARDQGLAPRIDLHIAGSISKECEFIHGLIEELGLRDRVHLHGRLDHDRFISLLSSVDLCLALRYPTMGETSAIVMRVMQAGVPVIVSDVGWYSELPPFIPKIKPATPHEVQTLRDQLLRLATDHDTYRSLRDSLHQFALRHLDMDQAVSAYVQAVS